MVSRARRRRDHPRSRGGYGAGPGDAAGGAGSSPLARGLHDPDPAPPGEPRIIPARAGFTLRPPAGRRGVRDHPRSRGVYSNPTPPSAPEPGSSPLARGLPWRAAHVHQGDWIIPARAGFTCGSGRCAPGAPDHPRSRGVYRTFRCRGPRRRGSSPLARGLRFAAYDGKADVGIIPARAGFTRPSPGKFPPHWDHPRSRGVYCARLRTGPGTVGSSPLARGLLLPAHRHGAEPGIIPARAGFTELVGDPGGVGADHPRSRGVYSRRPVTRRRRRGSSPLARGLP